MRKNQYGQMVGDDLPGWTPRLFPQKITLNGSYCRLEPVSIEKHAQDLYEAHNLPDDGKLWTFLQHHQPAGQAEFLSYMRELSASNDPLHFAVIDRKSNKALGSLALMRIDAASGVVEIGHVNYSLSLQKTIPATEAIYLLLRYIYEDLGYRRCEWKCDNFNEASKKTALRFGFSFEGVFRQAVITKGRNRDTAWFASIDQDWPALKRGFESWLDASNFDAKGQQKRKLGFL